MTKLQKTLIGFVATAFLMLVTSAVSPWVPMSLLALGVSPSSQSITATTTSATTFVQQGWNRLTCSSDVYYKLVSAYDTAVTSTTGTLLRGPQGGNGLPKPAWFLVSSDRWLAILLKSGTTATCMVEVVSLDGAAQTITNLTVTGTAAVTGATTLSSTLTTTGPNTLGLYTSLQDAGLNNLTVTGNETVAGTLGVTGATTLAAVSATGTNTFTGYTSLADGGVNNLVSTNTVTLGGGGIVGTTVTRGSGALNNASPSIFTATVVTGAICVCANNTTQTVSVKCAVSGTTLTITGPNTTTDTVSYICMQ